MAKLKDAASSYEPPKTKNIADLELIPTDIEITEKVGIKKNKDTGVEEEFRYNVVTVKGVEYRVPNSVLKSLKVILAEKPNLKFIKVKKTGELLNTDYTVIPIE